MFPRPTRAVGLGAGMLLLLLLLQAAAAAAAAGWCGLVLLLVLLLLLLSRGRRLGAAASQIYCVLKAITAPKHRYLRYKDMFLFKKGYFKYYNNNNDI